MPRQFLRATATATAVIVLVALAGCGGSPAPTPTPTPTSTPTPSGDGVLTIGTLFPASGNVAFLGPAQRAGVAAAVRDINAAGGVNGEKVVVVARDSGVAATEKAEKSFAELVEEGVDVVIGPSSSVLAQRLLEPAAAAGIPLVSPAATYPQLTALDGDDVFFRTVASSPHQAIVLAGLFAEREVSSVAIVYRDDDPGATLAAALDAALAGTGIDLTAVEVAADATADDIAAAVDVVAEADPDAVVLATPDNGSQTKTLIKALSKAKLGGSKLWLTTGNLADYSQALPGGLLKGVNGLLDGAAPDSAFRAKVKKEDPRVADLRYAAEAYDATVLAALAAVLAGDDGGASIARMLRPASIGGIKCTSYAECLDVLTTRSDVDYDGVSGSVNLDVAGDPERGGYSVVKYGAGNKYTRQSFVVG